MSGKWLYVFSVTLVALAGGGCTATAHKREHPQSWPTVPSGSQVSDVWVTLLALINKHGGYVSRDDFETTFDMTFENDANNRSGATFHNARQGRSWILDGTLEDGIFDSHGKPASYLVVQFRDIVGKKAANPCLSPEAIFKDLNRSGWQGAYDPSRHLEMHADGWTILRRNGKSGDYVARVWSSPICVLSVSVGQASLFE
jgi:hypothetical protein